MTHHNPAKPGKKARPFARVLRDQRAVASIEFALIIALIAIAGIQALFSLGGSLADTLTTADAAIVQDRPAVPNPDGPF